MAKRPLTPIRRHLRDDSTLHREVADNLQALEASHRQCIDITIRNSFADSLDLDGAFRVAYPQDNRWDYLLGLKQNPFVVGLEPHSAKDDEVSNVVEKCRAARQQLRSHLRDGHEVQAWFWVASGSVKFAPTGKAVFRLSQGGVTFVGTRLRAKHLAEVSGRRG